MIRGMLLALLFMLHGQVWAADENAGQASEASVRKLMELTGATDLAASMVDQMIPMMKRSQPDMPDEFWQAFREEAKPDFLMMSIIPIYQKHLTQDEVSLLIDFYQTDVGRKLVSVQPMIMQEYMMAGQSWGKAAAMRAFDRLKRQRQQGKSSAEQQ